MINIAASLHASPNALYSVLGQVSAANLTSVLLELLSSRTNQSRHDTIGPHLGWTPIAFTLNLLTSAQLQLAVNLINGSVRACRVDSGRPTERRALARIDNQDHVHGHAAPRAADGHDERQSRCPVVQGVGLGSTRTVLPAVSGGRGSSRHAR
jgi:hypothetical protein